MASIQKILLSKRFNDSSVSLFLLALRILFGVLLFSHGLQKLTNFTALSEVFPDPLGVGSSLSLGLAIFAELFCSAAFVLGLLHRLVTIPMIFTMVIAFFVIHSTDPFATKELAFIYLVVFILLFITGPGRYSLDYKASKILCKKRS